MYQPELGISNLSPRITNVEDLSDQELAKLCWLNTDGSSDPQIWLAANHEANKRSHQKLTETFRKKGWAHTWFLDWKPKTQEDKKLADTLESSLHVVEIYYPQIEARGLHHADDLGILQAKGWGGSEGIMAKKGPYQEIVHIQILCTTGPSNFDPSDQTLKFENGAKSHFLHLAHQTLPKLDRLLGDVAAYPLIRSPKNHLEKNGKTPTYYSEGFQTSELSHNGIPCHKPWDTLTPNEISQLQI
jgi:hypothetical protein